MVSVMSAETAAIVAKRTEEAIREVQPATKADVDRLFAEIVRLQDAFGQLYRQGCEPPQDTSAGDADAS